MIVGISGLAGSGKDTAADFFVRNHDFVRVSLADPVKRVCADIYGFSFDQLWGPSPSRNAPDERFPREHGPFRDGRCACCGFGFDLFPFDMAKPDGLPQCYLTPRFALQQLGTEWGRDCFSDTWVTYALTVAGKLSVEGGYSYTPMGGLAFRVSQPRRRFNVVIPDVRFKNEIAGLHSVGAILVRIVRPNAGLSGVAGAHRSETELSAVPDSTFNAVVQNDGTLAVLEERVAQLIGGW
jgi:hypothetical protein